MSALRLAGAVLVVIAGTVLLVPERAAAAPGPPVPRCNGGGCDGWFKSAVTVTWDYDPAGVTATSGCAPAGVSDDTAGATFTCTVTYGGPFYGNSVTVRKDSSPPQVNGTVSRDPDVEGWYTKPVSVGSAAATEPPASRRAAAVDLRWPRRRGDHAVRHLQRQRGQLRLELVDDQVRLDRARP